MKGYTMHSLPLRRIPGTKETLSETVSVSFLIDRMLVVEIGKASVLFLTPDEAKALYGYLHRNKRKFTNGDAK